MDYREHHPDDLDEVRLEAAAERRDLERYERDDDGYRPSVEAVLAGPDLVEELAASLSHLSPCADCPDPALCSAERDCPRGEAA